MLGIGTAIGLYNGYHDAVPTPALKKQPKAARPSTSSSKHHSPSGSSFTEQLSSASVADFLESAVDSHSSPQELRQHNRQMKRTSHLQKQRGHRNASSESSSISSIAPSDRVPWDLALDNLSLVRRSSIRSNDSSIPSRDRPESTHNFGRGFFHRRGKSNRESSAHDSTSSVYSEDVIAENKPVVGGKEGILPSIFFRRKHSSDEGAPKRPQISHPFNFQHVAHTQRKNARNDSAPVALSKGSTGITGIPVLEHQVRSRGLPRSLSHDSLGGINTGHITADSSRLPLVPRHTAPSAPRRLLKQIRSQDQLRKCWSPAPLHPPPSPTQQPGRFSSFGLLPARASSRQFDHQDVLATLDSVVNIRSTTSTNVCEQSPFPPSLSREYSDEEEPGPCESSGFAHTEKQGQYSPTDKRFSSAISGARDLTWPLTTCTPLMSDASLPDVPEEEEHHWLSRRSRLSLASNHSSVRGIQSVPALRCLAESHRPLSGASETLGASSNLGTNKLACTDAQSPARWAPARESWEDLIDYCYEHEAEADCNFQWDRPSLDISRYSITPPGTAPAVFDFGLGSEPNAASHSSQASISPRASEAPSLSPASNNSSTQFESEAKTPNSAAFNNFSLPRCDGKNRVTFSSKELKRSSSCCLFRDSQTLILSPSLLPCDDHVKLVQPQAEKQGYTDFEFLVDNSHESAFLHDAASLLENNTSFHLTGRRISTCTTATGSTSRSSSVGRHDRSANSSWTTLTRCTARDSSLGNTAVALTDDSEPAPATAHFSAFVQEERQGGSAGYAAQDHVPDMTCFPPPTGNKKHRHRSHASESQVRNGSAPADASESSRPQRPRAQTTNLSAQILPPVGQYALFPRAPVKAIGGHI
ncbi:hypothetical protein E4U41_000656 [Claviceps citrina]|nr:hypothetical protein E4U41_000656 [Claviceps citrina]